MSRGFNGLRAPGAAQRKTADQTGKAFAAMYAKRIASDRSAVKKAGTKRSFPLKLSEDKK